MNKKRIAILGSTGTIGTQALDVVRANRDLFEVVLLCANNNSDLLTRQAIEFGVKNIVIGNPNLYNEIKQALTPYNTNVFAGNDSIASFIEESNELDLVLTAMVGFSGLTPTLTAIKKGITVAIANKEPVVAAGKFIMGNAAKYGATILPVDSEHSAIFQALQGECSPIENIFLTASGGPFLNTPIEQLENVTVAQAINHPRWKMGKKITVDSSTLMNKGFELIEASWLFNIAPEKIKIVIHPQSIIHSMVSFADGSIIAQMNMPDMRLPIQYALTYPQRKHLEIPRVDFFQLKALTFESPDLTRFPCLTMALEAINKGGNAPCILNAANEVAVEAFLNEKIKYTSIPYIVEKGLEKSFFIENPTLEQIYESDLQAREIALSLIK